MYETMRDMMGALRERNRNRNRTQHRHTKQ
jgi:hypothetical protein